MPVSKKVLDEVALSEAEYQLIVEKLGREPTHVELGMFGSLWSEHCGYKHSRALLKLFPTSSKRVLCRPGEENAGVVDIGDGQVVVMKVESHNHPSAIEPFQSAATGVGGIVRDIFTMGAFPIALLNSLRFGPLHEGRNQYLFNGVVGGIASYGNCLGIPDVAGEIYFDPTYSNNPLVNAMCVGLANRGDLVSAAAKGEGNPILLVGADTGCDGIHGASGLASRTFEETRELRSAVQVGNPFLEKLLIEACIEFARTDWIVGMQDLGAAGLTSAAIESAHKGGSGIEIDVMKVPRREEGMTPYEVMLSESQERMLVIARRGCEDKVKELFARWDLRCDVIGHVTGDGHARIKEGDKVVADAPVETLATAPSYRLRPHKPAWLKQVQSLDLEDIPDPALEDCDGILLRLLASPIIASKESVYRQYDHQVQVNTVLAPGGDAAVLRIKGTPKGIALTIDGNSRYCYLDPYVGGAIAVAEAARNLVCSGAEPIALTDCLNFGNPERPDVYYQLKECIRGMARACRLFKVPVISGNVSLYNETKGESIHPTPVVGMLGLLDDVRKHCTPVFREDGDLVFLLSGDVFWDDHEGLGGSEYLALIHGRVAGRPSLDIELEKRVQACCLEAVRQGVAKSAHDCSEGGLAVALAECCIRGKRGFHGTYTKVNGRKDTMLFGESQSRIVVSVAPKDRAKLDKLCQKHGVSLTRMGKVGGQRFVMPGYIDLPVDQIEQAWRGGLK